MKKYIKLYEEFEYNKNETLNKIKEIIEKYPSLGKNVSISTADQEFIITCISAKNNSIIIKIESGDIMKEVLLNDLSFDDAENILDYLINKMNDYKSRDKLDDVMKSEKERVDKLLLMEPTELLTIADKGKELNIHHGFTIETPKQEIVDFILDNDLDLFHSI